MHDKIKGIIFAVIIAGLAIYIFRALPLVMSVAAQNVYINDHVKATLDTMGNFYYRNP